MKQLDLNLKISSGPAIATAAALALLAGCAAVPEPASLDDSVVVLQPFEELGGTASDPSVSCKAGFRYVYAPDLPVHSREVFYDVAGSSMLSGGGPLELPRPERDPRPTQRDDGLMELEVVIATFGNCRRPETGQGPLIEFTVGECVAGDCPPMRFEVADGVELVQFRLAEG